MGRWTVALFALWLAATGCATRNPYAGLASQPPKTLGNDGLGFGWGSPMACSFLPGGGGFPGGGAGPMLVDGGLALGQVQTICRQWNIPMIPIYRQEGLRNAVAYTPSPSMPQGFIVFDPSFFNALCQRHGRETGMGILAHEVGHIATGIRVPPMIADWSDEARADHFAGATLARLRVSRAAVKRAFLSDFFAPDHRHPDGVTRVRTLEQGYVWGGGSPFDE